MDLTEQIARALAEAEHGEGAWEHLADGWHTRYLALAQAVLPFIAAERERCAVIADQPIAFDYVHRATPDGPWEAGSPYDRGRQFEAERIAAAIRSQQP